jgi:hypothetical protein
MREAFLLAFCGMSGMADNSDNSPNPEGIREWISGQILGDIRLANKDRELILEGVFECHIVDEVDEAEHASCKKFVASEYDRIYSEYQEEKKSWPETTDCDRLDDAVRRLNRKGIVLWPVSPCCNTCTMAEFPEYIDQLCEQAANLKSRLRGYSYFIDQSMSDMLQDSTDIDVYLGYGPTDKVGEKEYEGVAVAIGHEIFEGLKSTGLTVEWDGELKNKIYLLIKWQQRHPQY